MADPTLRPGQRHAKVLELKLLLIRSLNRAGIGPAQKKHLGMNHLSPVYNLKTVAAVKAYQKRYKLGADGIVGPKTWTKLRQTGKLIVPEKPVRIIPRSEWGADAAKGTPAKVQWDSNTTSWLHHTVTKAPRPSLRLKGAALVAQEKEHMRLLQDIAFKRGFSDISYSYVVFPSGNCYEGRGKEVLGAHTLGHNSDVGIALAGNYEEVFVTNLQHKNVLKLRNQLGVGKGAFNPHSDSYPTACPGKNAKAKFKKELN